MRPKSMPIHGLMSVFSRSQQDFKELSLFVDGKFDFILDSAKFILLVLATEIRIK